MSKKPTAAAWILFAGIAASSVLLAIGLLLQATSPQPAENLHFLDLRNVPRQILSLSSVGFLHLGILLLMATPFTRLFTLIVEFARAREFAFVWITAGVLLLLIISIAVGVRSS